MKLKTRLGLAFFHFFNMLINSKNNRINRKCGFTDEGSGIVYDENIQGLNICSWQEPELERIWIKIEESVLKDNFNIVGAEKHNLKVDSKLLSFKNYPVDFI